MGRGEEEKRAVERRGEREERRGGEEVCAKTEVEKYFIFNFCCCWMNEE